MQRTSQLSFVGVVLGPCIIGHPDAHLSVFQSPTNTKHLEIQGNHATATINNGTITTAATAAVGRTSTYDNATAAA